MIKRKLVSVLLGMFFLLSISSILAAGVPAETVIAEFDGGTITMGQLEERIEMIPPLYQQKYSTPEGKASLLNDLGVEEMFYLEALARNVKGDKRYFNEIDNQIKSVYYNVYKKDLVDQNLTFTDKEKKAYFNDHADMFADKKYEDAEGDIEWRLRPEKEKAIMDTEKQNLLDKYAIVYHDDVINEFNMTHIDSNSVIAGKVLVASNNPDIEITVGELVEKWNDLPEQNKAALINNENLKTYLTNYIELEVFFLEAVGKDYENNEEVQKTVAQIHRTMMLRTVYNQLVVDTIALDTLSLKKYYEVNIDKFSSNPYRKIQTFGFKTEQEAKDNLKTVKNLVKKNDEEGLKALIKEKSEYKVKDGVLDHIYKNQIIPGLGKDEIYSDYVWKAKENKFSKIFKNSKDIWVFFRLLEDIKAVAEPFEESINKIKRDKLSSESREKFGQVSTELTNKYHLKTYPEKLTVILSAEDYFNKAEAAQKRRGFKDAIFYYDQIIKNYQNNSDDYKATFMKGFIYSEEMDDKENARQCYENVINNFPEAELHESARYMLDELAGKHQDVFENEIPEENVEEPTQE